MPLDAETLTNFRKTLPPPKPSTKSVIINSINTYAAIPVRRRSVTQPVDLHDGCVTATNPNLKINVAKFA